MTFELKRNLSFSKFKSSEDILYLITRKVTDKNYIGVDYYGNYMVLDNGLCRIVGKDFTIKNPRLSENDLINLSMIERAMNHPKFIAFTIDPNCNDFVNEYKIKNKI